MKPLTLHVGGQVRGKQGRMEQALAVLGSQGAPRQRTSAQDRRKPGGRERPPGEIALVCGKSFAVLAPPGSEGGWVRPSQFVVIGVCGKLIARLWGTLATLRLGT